MVRGHITALRFDLIASILLLYEYEHEHGSWHLTAVLPELAPYCSATDKTSRRYACDTNPITCRADTPATRTRLGRALLPRLPARWSLALWTDPVTYIILLPKLISLVPIYLQDKHITSTVLLYEPISSVPICLRNQLRR
jgi:hypothetical protein